MPRTVNFSDNNGGREKKQQSATPAESRLFGFWSRTPAAPNTPVESPTKTSISSPADTPVVAEIDAPILTAVLPDEVAVLEISTLPEAPLLSEQILAKSVPEEIVGTDGSIDFDRLFQSVRLPTVTVNAEHAMHILGSIPAELPMRVKRLAVKTSLNLMSDLVQESSVSTDIVTDAAQKMLWIARLQENVNTEIEARREATREEIARLEAEILAKSVQLSEAEQRATAALRACRHRTNQLSDVMQFFDHQEDSSNGSNGIGLSSGDNTAHDNEEELPPHLRDESVLRLLGLQETPAEDNLIALPNGVRRYA